MPSLQALKCALDQHPLSGWRYLRDEDCTQVRSCACGKVTESRIEHEWGEWEILSPAEASGARCEHMRRCLRDAATERRTLHARIYRCLDDETHLVTCERCPFQEVQPHAWESTEWEQYDWERDIRDSTCRECGYKRTEVGYIGP